jgi:hypothetical protein
MKLHTLLTIGGVKILVNEDGTYVQFISDLDVCNDGSGPAHGDPYHQSETAYYNDGKFLNADKDRYVVVPPQIRSKVNPVVMGCQARLTNLETDIYSDAMVGDVGPSTKTGEAAYCLAKKVNPSIDHNIGDSSAVYLYELWPGMPAVVGKKQYELEPA